MTHVKYNKVHRIGKDEVQGILNWPVTVQEKIDGANASIWLEDDEFRLGTRNNEVSNFRGLWEYVDKHEGIKSLLLYNPNFRLFGEWLKKHTLSYDETSYDHFYLFDIYLEDQDKFIDPCVVQAYAEAHNIKHPKVFFKNEYVTEEQLREVCGQSDLGKNGEGVVIKNPNFESKFGVKPQYAKMVTQKFTEDNQITFGGNNKSSETYWEQYICNNWMTLGRVKKIMQKIESSEDRQLEKSDTPTIAQRAYHDMLEEEIWTIQKKVPKVDFKKLNKICTRKAVKIFHDLLEGNDEVSVAYE